MGEPVRIVDLAQDLIRLSGLGLDDVPIVFTSIRPGEKLEEILFDPGMQTQPTSHPDVLKVVGPDSCVRDDLDAIVSRLEEAARNCDRRTIEGVLARTIPGFAGRASGLPSADPAPIRPESIH